ncbi:MAG: hypothetical protein OXC70_05235 [Gammaproteobacteria bacterium]|nr:hypothetical protein [Gammaproteobacteria bacterium]
MKKLSTQNLSEQLRAKQIEHRQAVERITKEQFDQLQTNLETLCATLKKNLKTECSDVNELITENTADLKRGLGRLQVRFWVIPFIGCLLLVPALILGTLWTNNYLEETILEKAATLRDHQQALDALTAAGITHQKQGAILYLITANDREPKVYQVPNYPDRWIVKIEE